MRKILMLWSPLKGEAVKGLSSKINLVNPNGVIYDKVNYFAHGIHPKEVPQTVFEEAYEMSDSTVDEVKKY